jgi:tripartite-type tricarboxylate transporter receptor subunit TctC
LLNAIQLTSSYSEDKMKKFARRFQVTLTLLGAFTLHNSLHAQTYPTKPVHVIVPYEPGAGADFITRLFIPGLTEEMKSPFIVDNRGGATGSIGVGIAARSAPDGYTLVTISGSHTITQAFSKVPTYDLTRDFDSVALFASTPYTLAVHPSVSANNLKELIALAKANPGKLTFGSSGEGSGTHLAGELLKFRAGIDMLHVPYKGTAQAISDLVGGRLSMVFATQVMPQVKAGRLRAIAITSAERSAMATNLPTVIEAGFSGFNVGAWFALSAPAGVPKPIVRRLNEVINKTAQTQDIGVKLMNQSSAEPMLGSPEQAGAYVRDDIQRWREIIENARITLQQ